MNGREDMFEGKWEDAEVIDLFRQIEQTKEKKLSIKQAFAIHAQKYSRRPNSVRNYYYHEVDDLIKNKDRLKKLGINISKHKKQEVKLKDDENKKLLQKLQKIQNNEGEQIVKEIDKLVLKGNSVRQACLKLSGGNVALMLRYQNKYRNNLAKKQNDNISKPINILEYKNKQKTLSDVDINSLFLGLVKLVKKMAYEQAAANIFKEKESMGYLLKKALIDLNKSEKEVKILKESCMALEQENKNLVEKISNLKLSNAKELAKKISQLKEKTQQIN